MTANTPAREGLPELPAEVAAAFRALTREDSTPEEIEARMFLMRHLLALAAIAGREAQEGGEVDVLAASAAVKKAMDDILATPPPPSDAAQGESLTDRIAYALAAYEVWGGQVTPDEALKDPEMKAGCYGRAELIAEIIATPPTIPPVRVDEAMVEKIVANVKKWMGPVGQDIGVAHTATLRGTVTDAIRAAHKGEENG